jgi:hypothetical protein
MPVAIALLLSLILSQPAPQPAQVRISATTDEAGVATLTVSGMATRILVRTEGFPDAEQTWPWCPG